jgi:hypothetical protein
MRIGETKHLLGIRQLNFSCQQAVILLLKYLSLPHLFYLLQILFREGEQDRTETRSRPCLLNGSIRASDMPSPRS